MLVGLRMILKKPNHAEPSVICILILKVINQLFLVMPTWTAWSGRSISKCGWTRTLSEPVQLEKKETKEVEQ